MERDELAGWLRLALTPRVGPATARRLLAAFGLPQQVFAASPAALRGVVHAPQAEALARPPANLDAQVAATLGWLDQAPGRRLLTLADADYPCALLEGGDPPLMLYVQGRGVAAGNPIAWPRQALAIVGSRNPTAQGLDNARAFAANLAQAGWCVVSGLALGVDGAAHEGALAGAAHDGGDDGALATIAVMGTGPDRVYPARHQPLAGRIAQRGLLLTEYPPGTPPLAENFPRRNRIIAGLARGTLVVEAALQSGSLVTARYAVEQGREVFAIPGSIHSPQARGCHALIRQGAKLVETVQDILEELAPGAPSAASLAACGRPGGEPAAKEGGDPVLQALGFDPATTDALVARTGLPTSRLLARLLELELEGLVAHLPGGLFQRVARA